MSALHEAIDQYQTGDPDETTRLAFKHLGVPIKWQEVFYRVTRDEARRRYRTEVRHIEQAPPGDDHTPHDTQHGNVTNRAALLSLTFYNGELRVSWGSATIADHQGRIDFQMELCRGINNDIRRHKEAIDLIVAAGVTCLADIKDAA